MPVLVKIVREKYSVAFDDGLFDEWCVYVSSSLRPRYAPKDTEYFARLKALGNQHGCARIYNDFLKVYKLTTNDVNPEILTLITSLTDEYGSDAEEMDLWFTVIYAGMVAEENKQHAVLKKRIKRLGIHQVLLENREPAYAANFSRGKKWQELDLIMQKLGF